MQLYLFLNKWEHKSIFNDIYSYFLTPPIYLRMPMLQLSFFYFVDKHQNSPKLDNIFVKSCYLITSLYCVIHNIISILNTLPSTAQQCLVYCTQLYIRILNTGNEIEHSKVITDKDTTQGKYY